MRRFLTLVSGVAVLGAAGLGFNALRLRPWARTRERQMEYIAARAVELVGDGSGEGRAQPPSRS